MPRRGGHMTIWAQRTFAKGVWAHVQDLFDKHLDAVGYPANVNMLMVNSNEEWNQDHIIIALPDRTLLPMYEGFKEIGTEGLPKVASLLVGSQTSFQKLFKFKRDDSE
jgi:hypothetical protein